MKGFVIIGGKTLQKSAATKSTKIIAIENRKFRIIYHPHALVGQKKQGNLGFIVEEPEDLEKVEILSDDLVDKDKKKIGEPINLVVTFD